MNDELNMSTCDMCGAVVANDTMTTTNRGMVCEECIENEFIPCDICGDYVHENDAFTLQNGDCVCRYCSVYQCVNCEDCGDLIRNSDNYGDEGVPLCEGCREYYATCYDCGNLVHDNDINHHNGDCYCDDCIESHRRVLHDYGYRPNPIFHGESAKGLYYGVELEVDDGNDRDECCERLQELTEDVYLKYDGSLNDGIEIVSHPCTLEYHLETLKWRELIDVCLGYDYRSHSAGTCGLHVHVSKQALGYNDDERDLNIAKIMLFVDRNWDNMVKFSRRSYSSLERWAKRVAIDYTDTDTVQDLIHKAKNSYYDRYTAVNIGNRNTVEFRMFRGTLNINTFRATLQLLDSIINACINTDLIDLHRLTWDAVANHTGYMELNKYLEERNLNTEVK